MEGEEVPRLSVQDVAFLNPYPLNVVGILGSTSVANHGTSQPPGLARVPVEVLKGIIDSARALALYQPTVDAIAFKRGILSLMTTCSAVYARTRPLFQCHVAKYLAALSGKYRSVKHNTLYVYNYSEVQSYPYNFTIDLNTEKNEIAGEFVMCPKIDRPAVTFPVQGFDVFPIFGEYISNILRVHDDSARIYSNNLPKPHYEDILSTEKVNREARTMFKLTGLLLKLYTSIDALKTMNETAWSKLGNREDFLQSVYSLFRADDCHRDERALYTQILTVPYVPPEMPDYDFDNDLTLSEECGKIELNFPNDTTTSKEKPVLECRQYTKKEWVATSSLSKPEEEFPQRPDSPPEIIRIFRKMCGVGTLNPLEKFSGASERNGESLSSVDLLSEPQECCHGVVSQLVQIVCPTIDSESKRRISDKVARACLAPPGMTEEELTSMILMEWNELSL